MVGVDANLWHEGDDEHGNMVAGVIRAIAPEAGLFPIRASGGSQALAKAIQFLISNAKSFGISTLSMSFGANLWPSAGLDRTIWPDTSCESIARSIGGADAEFAGNLEQLSDSGVGIFAASGNAPTLAFNNFTFPACLESVHSIGALGRNKKIAPYVTVSSDISFVAPDFAEVPLGSGIHVDASGTSAATPAIAASFAILRSANETASKSQILEAMAIKSELVDDVLIKKMKLPQIASSISNLAGVKVTKTPQQSFKVTWLEPEDQSALNNSIRTSIDANVSRAIGAKIAICTGIYGKAKSAVVALLIRKRAANTCAYISKRNPMIKVWYQSKETASNGWHGKVLVVLK